MGVVLATAGASVHVSAWDAEGSLVSAGGLVSGPLPQLSGPSSLCLGPAHCPLWGERPEPPTSLARSHAPCSRRPGVPSCLGAGGEGSVWVLDPREGIEGRNFQTSRPLGGGRHPAAHLRPAGGSWLARPWLLAPASQAEAWRGGPCVSEGLSLAAVRSAAQCL